MFVCCALPFTGYGYTTEPKPLRNPKQIKERLKFAKEHEHWLNEWNNVMWSDDEAHLVSVKFYKSSVGSSIEKGNE